jgi:hypothetical protein
MNAYAVAAEQVGPVLNVDGDAERYKGQFISAGYSGHGMPRAFGW